eukprot:TRINITY_DN494_c0_g1_i1.p1 TRINITY_DN494_c0_g1~~TRINITY_DN494_c0_g1_i1.p1  ORF type:complete len:137 (+),score=39.18 TRINITY_DN494_c0_g1_i1:26-436(+)
MVYELCFFFFSSRRRHTRFLPVSWARRCVQETGINAEYMGNYLYQPQQNTMKGLIIFAMIIALGLSFWRDCARSNSPAECLTKRGEVGPCQWSTERTCFDPTLSLKQECEKCTTSECGLLVRGCVADGYYLSLIHI